MILSYRSVYLSAKTSHLKMFLVILLVGIAATNGASDENPYLFYFQPEAQDRLPGLYGGRLEDRDHPKDLRREVLTCAGQRKGLNVSSMSYDPSTKKVYVLSENMDDTVTLVVDDPCKGINHGGHCAKNVLINSKIEGENVKIGPVVTLNGSIYFMLRSCVDDTFVVEIRQLHTNCSHHQNNFNITECSHLLINLMRRKGCTASLSSFIPLEHLLVTETTDRQRIFIFQVRNHLRIMHLIINQFYVAYLVQLRCRLCARYRLVASCSAGSS